MSNNPYLHGESEQNQGHVQGHGGGAQQPGTSSNLPFGNATLFGYRIPSLGLASAPYPANVNDLLAGIPDMQWAVPELNSLPRDTPPHRDIPSMIIAHLQHPPVTGEEPDWQHLLQYFKNGQGVDGHNNLRDLYIFVTRVAIPNAIIFNRGFILRLYLARPNLTNHLRVRWDAWAFAAQAQRPTGPLDYATYIPHLVVGGNTHPNPMRPIFRSKPNPDGDKFVQWLHSLLPIPNGQQCPGQLLHHPGELDKYLNDDELQIRNMLPEYLCNRAVRVFNIWWFLEKNNSRLGVYERNNWQGIDAEAF